MCVLRFCDLRRKVRNLKYFLGNKSMLRPLFATWRFPVFGHGSKCYLFCFKSMPKINFRPIAPEEGSQKDQYSIGSSKVSGRARPEIAKARNTHKCTDILWFWGGGNHEKAGNVQMCYLFCFKSMLQMRNLRNLENHDFNSNFEVAWTCIWTSKTYYFSNLRSLFQLLYIVFQEHTWSLFFHRSRRKVKWALPLFRKSLTGEPVL